MSYLVEIIVTPGSGNVTASPRSGGTGTAAAGYPITQVASNLHTITIDEVLLGPWVLVAGDGYSLRVLEFKAGKDEYLLSENVAADAGACDYPDVEDVEAGVVYGGGAYTGVLDVGTGLPIPEYPPGSAGL